MEIAVAGAGHECLIRDLCIRGWIEIPGGEAFLTTICSRQMA
jgi:hypothetical protein